MRIALLTDGLWPDSIGGMQKHSYYLAKYLSLNGIQVDLYYCAKDMNIIRNLFTFDELLNIKLFKVPFPEFKISFPGHYVFSSYRYSKALYQSYRQQPAYDFTYAQGFTGWYFINKGLQIGSNLHGLEMFQKAFGFKSQLIQYLLKVPAGSIIRKSAVSFSLGGKLTDILRSHKALQIKETPIGIGEDWLNKNEKRNDKTHFVFVGRNEKRKGLDNLFEVLDRIDSQSFSFHFIGIDQPENIVKNDCLVFHGEVKDAVIIQQILSESDVLVCPSIAEGMPTVILEAMAAGLAIIATDTGATALLVDSQNGHLLQPGDKEALFNSIHTFIAIHPDELQRLKNNSFLKVAEKYIWPVSIKTTIQALQYP